MAKSVYIETTIPGAYFEDREDVVSKFQYVETRQWWDTRREAYELFTSDAVLIEVGDRRFPRHQDALRFLADVAVLPMSDEIEGVAQAYIQNKVMPQGDMGDAYHLAFASVYVVDYLMTWNCRHLANANKIDHIVIINRRLGLLTPAIVTPQMLLGEDHNVV